MISCAVTTAMAPATKPRTKLFSEIPSTVSSSTLFVVQTGRSDCMPSNLAAPRQSCQLLHSCTPDPKSIRARVPGLSGIEGKLPCHPSLRQGIVPKVAKLKLNGSRTMSAFGTKRTSDDSAHMSAFDPKRTFASARNAASLFRRLGFRESPRAV